MPAPEDNIYRTAARLVSTQTREKKKPPARQQTSELCVLVSRLPRVVVTYQSPYLAARTLPAVLIAQAVSFLTPHPGVEAAGVEDDEFRQNTPLHAVLASLSLGG